MAGEVARLTGDVVLISRYGDELYVLLIELGHPPFEGRLAFPGGHVDPGEETEAAARRELDEEVGLAVDTMTLIGVYATPGRDPRGRYATWAYLVVVNGLPEPIAGDDARSAFWVPVSKALYHSEVLAFDHHRILTDAMPMVEEAHIRTGLVTRRARHVQERTGA